MYTNNCLQHRAEMSAVKRRKAQQTKIKNCTADVNLSLIKHLKSTKVQPCGINNYMF